MKMCRWMTMACVAVVPHFAHGQQPWRSADHIAAIPRARLDSISDRGQTLAQYSMSLFLATEAVKASHADLSALRMYIAKENPDGRWEVVFGRPSANADTFYVLSRALQNGPGENQFTAGTLNSPIADVGYYARASRAIDAGRRDFGRADRPYNTMVVPVGGSDDWYVYLVPAQTVANVWPLGGDVRYRVSGDGRKILETRRLHNAVIEFTGASQDGKKLAAGMHAAVLADVPEDTDVLHVLMREPSVPEYIVTKSYYFTIRVDGIISAFDRDTTIHH